MRAVAEMRPTRPHVTSVQAGELASKFFGIQSSASKTKELVSYDDRNFYIEDENGNPYVLKVHNSDESVAVDLLEAQNQAMLRLGRADVLCPTPIPKVNCKETKNGQLSSSPYVQLVVINDEKIECFQPHTSQCGTVHAARVLQYIPGKLLGHVPQSPQLHHQLGQYLGRLSHSLEGWHAEAFSDRSHDWALTRASEVVQRTVTDLSAVFSEEQRQLLLAATCNLDEALHSCEASEEGPLPQQVCHTDANELNILVDDCGSKVVGIIDFGDMCLCWRVAEAAVGALYMMLLEVEGGRDPLPAAVNVLTGFHSAQPLMPAELYVAPFMICARLAQSLTLGAASALANPDNAEYLLTTQAYGWKLLHQLLNEGGREQLWTSLVQAVASHGHDRN